MRMKIDIGIRGPGVDMSDWRVGDWDGDVRLILVTCTTSIKCITYEARALEEFRITTQTRNFIL